MQSLRNLRGGKSFPQALLIYSCLDVRSAGTVVDPLSGLY